MLNPYKCFVYYYSRNPLVTSVQLQFYNHTTTVVNLTWRLTWNYYRPLARTVSLVKLLIVLVEQWVGLRNCSPPIKHGPTLSGLAGGLAGDLLRLYPIQSQDMLPLKVCLHLALFTVFLCWVNDTLPIVASFIFKVIKT